MRELFNLDDNGRGGDRRDERPDSVATLLSEKETVGYQEGSELANVGYSSYPQDQESLYLPNTTMVLQSIINCEKVRDQHDLANELGITHSTMLSDAVEFHGFSNFPESVDHTPSPIIQAPDGDGGTVEIDKDEWPSFRSGIISTLRWVCLRLRLLSCWVIILNEKSRTSYGNSGSCR